VLLTCISRLARGRNRAFSAAEAVAGAGAVALPDPRWDRMVYPMRDCEEHLRSRAPNL